MADGDYGDEAYGTGADYFYDDEWLYIEDEVAFADELAESQIPSPGYSGVNAELMLEQYEYDTYEYFGELEYGSDAYWDVRGRDAIQANPVAVQRGSNKRKRASTSTSVHTDKRRRLQTGSGGDGQNVIWRDNKPVNTSITTITRDSPSFALFPDWRERFPEDDDLEWKNTMPVEMMRAARAGEEAMDEEADVERQALDSEMQEEGGHMDGLSGLEPDALRAILRAKLGDSGMDEEAFMAVISQMLSGGGTDEAAAQLASVLLESKGEDSGASHNWLTHQGVNMEGVEEKDDTVAEEPGPHASTTETKRPSPSAKRSRK